MKKTLQIARTELSLLFYSPIAWLLLVIFTIQGGLAFADLLADKEASQQLGTRLSSLTQDVFGGNQGFFAAMRKYLYLYVPLLSMGLLSREIGSGSIKLLQSSPVTTGQIVLGKYTGILCYCLLLTGVLGVFVGIGAFAIENLDFGFVCCALFGIYLLLAAYASIGLFLSSLTGYQVVAAISTLAVLGALNYIGEVGKGVDVLRDITHWFAMDRHTGYAFKGLLSSKDIIYFLLIIIFFLALTAMKLNAGRIIRSRAASAARYALLTGTVIAVGYITSLPHLSRYLDVTRFDTQSYTPQSLDIVRQIKGPVRLTTYANVLSNSFTHIAAPKFRNFEKSSLEQMIRYIPQLKLDYVVYYDTSAAVPIDLNIPIKEQAFRKAIAYNFDFTKILPPDSIRKLIDLRPESKLFVRILSAEGKSTSLRMFYDIVGYPEESEVVAALKRLLDQPVRIGVLTGNDERSIYGEGDKDYQSFTTARNTRHAWINQGAEFFPVNADSRLVDPDSLDLLMIADPYRPYDAGQLEHIHEYIRAGGNLLLMGEPGKQAILNPITKIFGVRLEEGTLFQESKELEPDLVQARFATHLEGSGFRKTKDTVITMPGASFLTYSDTAGFHVRPILETDKRFVWNRTEKFDLKIEPVAFREGVDNKIERAVAVAVTRQLGEREQRIFVAGDADFLSRAEFARFNVRHGNAALTSQMLRWYSYGEYPPDTERPESTDNRLQVSKAQVVTIRTVMVFLVPALLALWGALTIIRRKRK